MKQLIGILGLLLFVSCQNHSKFKTIMIKSYGEVETLPDMATFEIGLNCLDKSVMAAKTCIVEKSNELNHTLLTSGINKEDILTSSVNMNKSYSWKNNSRVFDGYKSSTTLFVTIRNIEKLDEIYSELLENEHLELGGLNYSHSKLDSLKNEAYVNALEKSALLTDKLLEKLPESKKEILKIGNVEISASMPETNLEIYKNEEKSSSRVSKNNSISISKGTVMVNATLFVEYQIN